MRHLIFVCFSISWAVAQNGRTHHENGHGWDIRLAVPGEPGSDYPTLHNIPRTSFSCSGKDPGYYADSETNCQVFRVCTLGATYGFQSFLCPNGTLFNQAVFVCDWWMNVNCGISQQLFSNNNEKFGNLKLGPQLMKDIKKMLTHPMRNPYDKTIMKSNLIVMQDYKPPVGQLFPNGALLASPERTPNNIYIPAKQNLLFGQNTYNHNDNVFGASTPNPQYIPASFNNIQTTGDAEVFQRQRQNTQYVTINRTPTTQSIIENGRLLQTKNTNNNRNSQQLVMNQATNRGNLQYGQKQINGQKQTQYFNYQNSVNTQREQVNRNNAQYTDNNNSGKQTEFGISYTKQQYNTDSNRNQQPYTYKTPLPNFSNELVGQVGNEAKQNLVSKDVITTISTKPLKFDRIVQEPRPGRPRSRITFKTWVVKPSKAARLVAAPTPYTYDKPTKPASENLIELTTPYVYNVPKSITKSNKIVSEPEPYVYNKPTVSAKQVSLQPSRLYLTPTTARTTSSARLILTPTPTTPTKASRIYIPPTTYKPAARLYLPPIISTSEAIVSQQFVVPNPVSQPAYYQSAQIRATAATPTPTYVTVDNENSNNPSFSLTKQSHVNANHNNLTFADILTKEKLDITVNDIVSDTGKFLAANQGQLSQYPEEAKSIEYSDETYLPPDTNNQSEEMITSETPTTIPQSARLIAAPSSNLEPPDESYDNTQNSNELSKLPFFKEPFPTNTIERTVTLRITIPERLATYLFKNDTINESDRLEILNTGSSNYLVLANKLAKNTVNNLIPIGKLIEDKKTNFSNSQALVYSFLADSINVAQEYSNIAKQNAISSEQTSTGFQNINNGELARITNQISELTSSQYSGNNYNSANIAPTSQTTTTNTPSQYSDNLSISKGSQFQSAQYNLIPTRPSPQLRQEIQNNNNNGIKANLLSNTGKNQLYSGQLYQLPVPDVTSHLQQYSEQSSAKLIQPKTTLLKHTELTHLQDSPRGNNDIRNNNYLTKQTSAEVEIVKSQTLPVASGKLQLAPSAETQGQENSGQNLFSKLLNSDNGISAQLEDKIVGSIPHPVDDNKIVTYKKDQSYYVYTKLNNGQEQNIQYTGVLPPSNNQQSAKLISNIPNLITFQFVPSVGYQLEDEKDQQRLLDTFQINSFGKPKNIEISNNLQSTNERQDRLNSIVDYEVNHPTSKQLNEQYNLNALYAGPSSYSAPQSSVGSLKLRQGGIQNNFDARLEQFDNQNNGYSKVTPTRQFFF